MAHPALCSLRIGLQEACSQLSISRHFTSQVVLPYEHTLSCLYLIAPSHGLAGSRGRHTASTGHDQASHSVAGPPAPGAHAEREAENDRGAVCRPLAARKCWARVKRHASEHVLTFPSPSSTAAGGPRGAGRPGAGAEGGPGAGARRGARRRGGRNPLRPQRGGRSSQRQPGEARPGAGRGPVPPPAGGG